jgi:hypothetical protein
MGRDMANSRVTIMARRPPPPSQRVYLPALKGVRAVGARALSNRFKAGPGATKPIIHCRGGWRIYEISSPMHNKNLFRDATETPPPAPHPEPGHPRRITDS